MLDRQLLGDNLFSNKKEIDFHMFGPGMHDRIVSKGNNREIVTVNNWRGKWHMKFSEKSLHPEKLCCSMSQASIFSFCAGSSNNWLLSRPPRDEVRTKVNGSTRGATSIIRI
jgi:hypothetical protein